MDNDAKKGREERARQVAQMNANFAIEGFEPSPEDKALQAEYIEGTKTLGDLLKHARDYAAKVGGKK